MRLRPSTPLSPLAGWLSLSLFDFYLFLGWGFMGPLSFFKALMNLLQYCFCCFFMLWIFSCKACMIFAPWSGIEPVHCVLEGKVLTVGPPGKSPWLSLWISLPRETQSRGICHQKALAWGRASCGANFIWKALCDQGRLGTPRGALGCWRLFASSTRLS